MGKFVTILFFLVFTFFNSVGPTQAQPISGSCITLGDGAQNYFGCAVNSGQQWSIDPSFGQRCDPGFQIDLGVCSGDWPSTAVCGTSQTCCVPCSPEPSEPLIPWGDACTPPTAGEPNLCERGNCQPDDSGQNRCLVSGSTLPFGASCQDTSECQSSELNEPLFCRDSNPDDSNPGLACIFSADRYCETNQDCIDRTGDPQAICTTNLCQVPPPTPDPDALPDEGTPLGDYLEELCSQQAGPFVSQCQGCYSRGEYVWTAIGCIPTSQQGISNAFLRFALAIAGGIALIMLLFGALRVTTSASNPERLKSGQEFITAAIIGLVFIVLSIAILQFIGVSLLQIPGF